jgi:hypothetical protein
MLDQNERHFTQRMETMRMMQEDHFHLMQTLLQNNQLQTMAASQQYFYRA